MLHIVVLTAPPFLSYMRLADALVFSLLGYTVTDISATVTPIDVKFCMMVVPVPDRKSPLLGVVPPGEPLNPKFLD